MPNWLTARTDGRSAAARSTADRLHSSLVANEKRQWQKGRCITEGHCLMNVDDARRLIADRGYHNDHSAVFDGLTLISAHTGRQARFTRCSFVGTDLRQATFDGTYFSWCNFRGANLRGASMRHISFSACDLRDVDFRDADLTGARFGRVNTGRDDIGRNDVTGADFAGALLRDVALESVIGWPITP